MVTSSGNDRSLWLDAQIVSIIGSSAKHNGQSVEFAKGMISRPDFRSARKGFRAIQIYPWEQLYEDVLCRQPGLQAILKFFEGKTANLERAFEI